LSDQVLYSEKYVKYKSKVWKNIASLQQNLEKILLLVKNKKNLSEEEIKQINSFAHSCFDSTNEILLIGYNEYKEENIKNN